MQCSLNRGYSLNPGSLNPGFTVFNYYMSIKMILNIQYITKKVLVSDVWFSNKMDFFVSSFLSISLNKKFLANKE